MRQCTESILKLRIRVYYAVQSSPTNLVRYDKHKALHARQLVSGALTKYFSLQREFICVPAANKTTECSLIYHIL